MPAPAVESRCIRLEFGDGSAFEIVLPKRVCIHITRPMRAADKGESTFADRFMDGSCYAGRKIKFAAYGEDASERPS